MRDNRVVKNPAHRRSFGPIFSPVGATYRCIRVTIGVAISVLVLLSGIASEALSIARDSNERKDIHRLYELALEGTEYDAAIDGLIAYTQRKDIWITDREYAFSRFEKLADPELKEYLLGVATQEIEIADGDKLSHLAHRAYWVTLLAEAKDEADEERVLLNGLNATITIPKEEQRELNATTVRSWAVEQLCTRGKREYFDEISSAINSYFLSEQSRQQIAFCRKQLELLDEFDSRLAVMEHVLENSDLSEHQQLQLQELDEELEAASEDTYGIVLEQQGREFTKIENSIDQRLRKWALKELFELDSEDANEILFEHFLRSLEEMKKDNYAITFVTTVTYLYRRNWTLEDFVDRGIDRNNIHLRDALYFASVKNLE